VAQVRSLQDTFCEFAGVATRSAVLRRAGDKTSLGVVEGARGKARLPPLLAAHNPDLFASSSVSIGHGRRPALSPVCRKRDDLTTMGGQPPTLHPNVVTSPDVDLFCRGGG
jgi:hypothetical protein